MPVTLNESNARCHSQHQTIARNGPVGQNTLPGSRQVVVEPSENALQTQMAMVDAQRGSNPLLLPHVWPNRLKR